MLKVVPGWDMYLGEFYMWLFFKVIAFSLRKPWKKKTTKKTISCVFLMVHPKEFFLLLCFPDRNLFFFFTSAACSSGFSRALYSKKMDQLLLWAQSTWSILIEMVEAQVYFLNCSFSPSELTGKVLFFKIEIERCTW